MYPVAYQIKNSEYKILFVCSKCGKNHRNKRADDDEIIKLPELIKSYEKYF
ncbi:RNHCP domain-containing protein [bacterium]|nr:RNHCP domain-containing protein [bacterium]